MTIRCHAAIALGCAALLLPGGAHACGVSAAGVASCSLSEHREENRPRWAASVNAIHTATSLRFSGSTRADQTRYGTLIALAYLPTPTLVLQAGMGVSYGGSLRLAGDTYRFSPGPVGSLGVDYGAFDDGRYFLLLGALLSASGARTRLAGGSPAGYEAIDLRVSAELGAHVADVFHPYAVARAFGGPVFWRYRGEAVTGTDTRHYQLGAGLGVRLQRWNAFVEGVPLGERALSGGLGVSF